MVMAKLLKNHIRAGSRDAWFPAWSISHCTTTLKVSHDTLRLPKTFPGCLRSQHNLSLLLIHQHVRGPSTVPVQGLHSSASLHLQMTRHRVLQITPRCVILSRCRVEQAWESREYKYFTDVSS